jgi:histidyl-tRNA synthetase
MTDKRDVGRDLPRAEIDDDDPGSAPGALGRIRPRVFKGTRDFLPAEMIRREEVFAYLRGVFRRYGFSPLETPAFEYLQILLGKYGMESEKLIFPLAYRDGRTLALRYDLTVPLARVVAQYPELPRPFKRYQMQPVWRAERHQLHRGRYREFYQCDADIVGEGHRLADAEILALAGEILAGLEVGSFKVRVNHRRILRGVVRAAGLPDAAGPAVLRAIDKIDKVGLPGVEHALEAEAIEDAARGRILAILDRPAGGAEAIRALGDALAGEPEIAAGCADLLCAWGYLESLGAEISCFEFRLDLARGLDYYTGAVFESFLESLPHLGSLTGGGRYDGLVGVFSEEDVPAVGTTIGIDRILAALEQSGRRSGRTSVTQVLVLQFGPESEPAALRLTGRLRRAGIATEAWYRPDRLKKQFAQADKRGIPVVLLQGPEEAARGEWTAKRLATGEQRSIPEGDLPVGIADWLQRDA